MNRLRNRRRSLAFDGLERRQFMAGNVTAGLDSAGALQIVGDQYDNQIGLQRGYADGVVIYSLDNLTTINGYSSRYFPANFTDIKVKLEGGADRLEVTDLVTRHDLQVWGGAGNDVIQIGEATIKDDLKIYPGGGFDLVELRGTTIGGLGVNSNNNDLEFLDDQDGSGLRIESSPGGTPTTVRDDGLIDVGSNTFNDPWVEINDASFDDLTINGHSNNPSSSLMLEIVGSTIADHLDVSSTYGPDEVTVLDSDIGNLTLSTGNHNDEVVLDGVAISGLFSADLGSNHDSLFVEDSTIGDVNVDTGSGNDTVTLNRVGFTGSKLALIALGSGSDSMTASSVTSAQAITFDAGEDWNGRDRDSLTLNRSSALRQVLIDLGFESVQINS
jgi:hypothetical protein